jgi:hypothetical protein
MAEMGSPFIDYSCCLFALDIKDISADVVSTVKGIINLEQLG